MKILVDADAMPVDVKNLLFRAADRVKVPLTLVANALMRHPESEYLSSIMVEGAFNAADDWIVEQAEKGDLVVTADIPLAARIVDKGAVGIDPRGTVFNEDNMGPKLASRNLMDDLRGAAIVGGGGGGPKPFNKKDLQKFASSFNACLTKLVRDAGA